MARWRSVVLVALVALVMGSVASSASTGREPFELKQLPRPTRAHGLASPPASTSSDSGTDNTLAGTAGVPAPRPSSTPSNAAASGVLVKFKSGTSDAVRNRSLSSRQATAVGSVGDTGYTKVKPSGDPAELVASLRGDPSVEAATLDFQRHAT